MQASPDRAVGRRQSRTGNAEADDTILRQLRDKGVPGHRDFVRSRSERLNPAVIGSPLPHAREVAARVRALFT